MVISDKNKYLFIEIPLTASWAIRNELVEFYGGTVILHKHATYPEFRRSATTDQRSYFVFAGIRNPLDATVSGYHKLKTDHKNVYSRKEAAEQLITDVIDLKRYQDLQESGADFSDSFKRYAHKPYGDMVDVSIKNIDYLIHFERIQEDFSEVLNRLGIQQVRPIPVTNKTKGRKKDFIDYYNEPEIIELAKKVFAPYMIRHGYAFPESWRGYHITWRDEARYRLWGVLRYIYLVYFRYSNARYARMVRHLRYHLMN